MLNIDIVKEAERIATEAHKDQKRWNGHPYITHPARVAEAVSRHCLANNVPELRAKYLIAVAWLHDVVEDTDWTIDSLRDAGFTSWVTSSVAQLTHDPEVDYADYIQEMVEFDTFACIVKYFDIEDNLRDIDSYNSHKGNVSRKVKYKLAQQLLKRRL